MRHDNSSTLKQRLRRAQRGAAAMEFALVLPILILLTYGLVVYAYVYIIQESINFAAQEAAEAAVAVDPTIEDYENTVVAQSRASAVRVLSWLPAEQRKRVLGDSNDGSQVQVSIAPGGAAPDQNSVTVVMTFTMNSPGPLFLQLDLPLIGPAPPIPNLLTATGVATL